MAWWQVVDARGFALVGSLVPAGAFPLMLFLTALGSAPAVIAQVCLTTAWLLDRGYRTCAGGLAGTVGLGWLFETVLKVLVHRPRPELPHLVSAGGYSFPSGHSFVSFVLYGYLVLLVGRLAPRWRWLRVPLLLVAVGIGLSRVYLGVHYPSDVLGGWALGAAWLALTWGWILRAPGRGRAAVLERMRADRGDHGGAASGPAPGSISSSARPARRWPGPVSLGLGLLGVAMAASLGIQAGGPAEAASCEVVVVPGLAAPADLVHTVWALYHARAAGLLVGDPTPVEAFYDEDREVGRWSREHDGTRIAHLSAWAAARQVGIERVQVHVRVARAEVEQARAWLEMGVTERITCRHSRSPGASSSFGVGAWHVMQFARRDGKWLVVRDWFSDPLHESPVVAEGGAPRAPPPATPQPQAGGQPQPGGQMHGGGRPTDQASAGGKYRREAAVRYADRYCGPAAGPDSHYNRNYRDYSYLGGDCASFVSQILSDPDAGGLSTDHTWRYSGGKGTRAWVRAEDLVYYLLDSGRAALVGRGRYPEVGMAPAGAVYRLQPGDVIAYEQGGEIRHVSLVVGHDPAGYPLVNSHTGDRYHVPWDLGWDARTVFWLLHITE
ncbi:MAG: amidase domain-containing protein [Bacillota bacterium]|nr:amidase domain-containing protein [Bacillota bacterium]